MIPLEMLFGVKFVFYFGDCNSYAPEPLNLGEYFFTEVMKSCILLSWTSVTNESMLRSLILPVAALFFVTLDFIEEVLSSSAWN